MMKLSSIEVLMLLLSLQRTEGLLSDAIHDHQRARRHQTTDHSQISPRFNVLPSFSLSDDRSDAGIEEADVSRRFFLHGATVAAFAGLGLGANAQGASAVDFPIPGSSKGNGQASQRAGGLANKIRNSCRVMVRVVCKISFYCILDMVLLERHHPSCTRWRMDDFIGLYSHRCVIYIYVLLCSFITL